MSWVRRLIDASMKETVLRVLQVALLVQLVNGQTTGTANGEDEPFVKSQLFMILVAAVGILVIAYACFNIGRKTNMPKSVGPNQIHGMAKQQQVPTSMSSYNGYPQQQVQSQQYYRDPRYVDQQQQQQQQQMYLAYKQQQYQYSTGSVQPQPLQAVPFPQQQYRPWSFWSGSKSTVESSAGSWETGSSVGTGSSGASSFTGFTGYSDQSNPSSYYSSRPEENRVQRLRSKWWAGIRRLTLRPVSNDSTRRDNQPDV